MDIAGRVEMASTLISMGIISTREDYIAIIEDGFADGSVAHWLSKEVISTYAIGKYPNAKIAAEIKSSPLYEALS